MDIHDDTTDRGESPRDGSPQPVLISLSEAAMLLCVATSTLSQAARSGWQCAGYDVRAWAVWENGRIVGYHIPPEVLAELAVAKSAAQSSHPSPDSVPYEPTYTPRPLSSMPAPAQMPAPWPPQMGGYGTGYAPPVWPPVAPAIAAAPAEPVAVDLRRIIEDQHTQADRSREEFERRIQSLREDNERLHDELRRAQDQHAKEIRESERQLTKLREDAFEKRLALREKLLDAQTDARLAEGGVEESWIERIMDRHGDNLTALLGGIVSAVASRVGGPEDEYEESDEENQFETMPVAPVLPIAPSFAASQETAETAVEYVSSEQVAELVRTGSSAQVDSELASLRASLSSADLIQLAGEVLQILHGTSSPADIGHRLRDTVAVLAPGALSVPPAAAVQVARGYGVVRGKQDSRWFLEFVRALQAGRGHEPAASDGVAVPPL